MPESATEHRHWPKRAAWLLILVVLVLLGVLFWEWIATEVCLRLAVSPKPRLSSFGERGLSWLGPRAVPHVFPYLNPRPQTSLEYVAACVIGQHWTSLTNEQFQAIAPKFFDAEVVFRRYHQCGRPIPYSVHVRPAAELPALPAVTMRAELLEDSEVVAFFEESRGRAAASASWAGSGHRSWWCASPPRYPGPPGSEEIGQRIQEPGEHRLRLSLTLTFSEERSVGVVELTHVITTAVTLPSDYLVPVTDAQVGQEIRDVLNLHIYQADLDARVCYWFEAQSPLPEAIACRPTLYVRETSRSGAALRGPYAQTAGVCFITGGEDIPLDELVREFGLEWGRTYHFRVVLKPDPEPAWLDPRITSYWAGELESDWVEVTVPEREEQ